MQPPMLLPGAQLIPSACPLTNCAPPTPQDVKAKVRSDFAATYATECCFWAVVQVLAHEGAWVAGEGG